MPDSQYQTQSYKLGSKGVIARYINDDMPPGSYQNLLSLESRAENALATRLGLAALTTDGNNNFPLGGPVYTVGRMKGLDTGFRYAAAAHNLYRRAGDTAGPFTPIASGLSGNPLSLAPYRPAANANPYMFIADDNVLLKDNGTLVNNWGIKPPVIPPTLQIGDPFKTIVENFDEGSTASFTLANVTGATANYWRFLFTTEQQINIGIQTINVPLLSVASFSRTGGVASVVLTFPLTAWDPQPGMKVALTGMPDPSFNSSGAIVITGPFLPGTPFTFANAGPDVPVTAGSPGMASILPTLQPGMLIDIQDFGGVTSENIYVITVTDTGFTAEFHLNHPANLLTGTTTLQSRALQGTVAANTVATVSKKVALNLSMAGSVPSQPTDYIQMEIQASDPQTIQEFKIFFDVGDGSFTQDYYWKSLVPATYQAAVSGTKVTSNVQTGRIFDRASSLADARTLGKQITDLVPTDLEDLPQLRPFEINTGLNAWSTFQAMLQEFVPVGLAGGENNNWANVVAWQIQITTVPNSPATFGISSVALIGGAGLDSFNGIPYDYRYTYYNLATGDESNGSVTLQSNYFLTPRRQPGAVTMTPSPDPQVTHYRIYRRGGTLTQAWYMVDQIPITSVMPYEDVIDDATIEDNDTLVIDNDAPIISVMRQPVNEQILQIETGQLWEPSTPFTVGQTALDSNGNQQELEAIILASITNVQLVFGLLTITTSAPFTLAQLSSLVGKRITFRNVATATFLNGLTVVIASAASGLGSGTLTANTILANYGPAADSGTTYILSGSGVSSGATPGWSLTTGVETVDGILLWINQGLPPTTFAGGSIATVTLPSVASVFPGQLVTVGSGETQEQAYVLSVDSAVSAAIVFLQSPHAVGEIFAASTRPLPGLNLMAIAFDQAFMAGDPDNPHVLYYSNPFNPETFPQENFVEVGTPDSPIMALVVLRGLLYVFTSKTVFQIYGGGGAVPIPVPTGCMHGLVANFAWAASENVIFYMSYDGVYAFQGSGSKYMTLDTEWVWTGKNLGPIPAIDTTQKASIFMAYANHELFVSYVDQTGIRRRLIWSENYQRWRPDLTTPQITSEFFEQDTGQFVVGGSDGMVYLDRINDYDSGGFMGGVEIKNPISFALQTAQMDQGQAKAFKVFNELTIDAALNGNTVNVFLVFDNGATIVPAGVITGTGRAQYQINIGNGAGITSLNVGLLLTGATTSVIYFNEIHIRFVMQAEYRRSFDSWWLRSGTENWKVWKQGWFEYAAQDPAGITFNVYVEGNVTTPAYTFTVPQSLTRVTKRVRFPAKKAKLWRIIGTSPGDFQFYAPESMIEIKPQSPGSGYAKVPLAP